MNPDEMVIECHRRECGREVRRDLAAVWSQAFPGGLGRLEYRFCSVGCVGLWSIAEEQREERMAAS